MVTGVQALARSFLAELSDSPGPWVVRFESWAAARGLNAAEARAVRVATLRLRVFGAIARGAARGPGRGFAA